MRGESDAKSALTSGCERPCEGSLDSFETGWIAPRELGEDGLSCDTVHSQSVRDETSVAELLADLGVCECRKSGIMVSEWLVAIPRRTLTPRR